MCLCLGARVYVCLCFFCVFVCPNVLIFVCQCFCLFMLVRVRVCAYVIVCLCVCVQLRGRLCAYGYMCVCECLSARGLRDCPSTSRSIKPASCIIRLCMCIFMHVCLYAHASTHTPTWSMPGTCGSAVAAVIGHRPIGRCARARLQEMPHLVFVVCWAWG